ncbi:hypothetical protein QFC20_000649 [Naganishia adeliensis]|uniref:Uncharacterized protein n=1 Tax=Naganishia adeliensis TaxID=92952 RepID=A0ACC2X011_9TREE|nr:hypothetical protein QFC20_000649 [Naganishia adeliensis]
MHLLGHNLPDHKLIRVALTSFHGVSNHTSSRILARLQIHEQALVSSLTEQQVTALSAFLSSPSNTAVPSPTPVCPPGATPHGDWSGFPQPRTTKGKARMDGEDPLQNLKIETDLRRSVQSDIAHMRTIGTYKGRRHAAGLPVRGQNTQTNAKTARKLNKVDRRTFSTSPLRPTAESPIRRPVQHTSALMSSLNPIVKSRFAQ